MRPNSWYLRFAKFASRLSGRPLTFITAVLLIVVWLATGPMFGFSNTWQLVINTLTTIVTFLMVFVIQSTQNRDTEALQIKLDELLRVTPGAHNVLLNLEELEEHELARLRAVYLRLAENARRGREAGRSDQGVPEIGELIDPSSDLQNPAPASRPHR